MRPFYDDNDEFAFGDVGAIRRIMREQQREELRFARRSKVGPGDRDHWDDDDYDDDDFDYDDYDDEEFDRHAGMY